MAIPKHVSAADAKAHFSSLIAEVEHGNTPIVIERHGRPVAALVNMDDLHRLGPERTTAKEPQGLLAAVGAWADLMDDEEIDAMVRDIYAQRVKDMPRPFDLPDE
jgi:prevent-host-death family protein